MTTTPHPRDLRAPLTWNTLLLDQIDVHWRTQLRPRLKGLSDAEYFWEPAPGAWSVRPRGTGTAPVQGGSGAFTIDFAFPEPEPPPVTTISWRLAHVIVGVLALRNHAHFAGPAADYQSFDYAGTADEALAQLDREYAAWTAGVRGLGEDDLARPCGEAEGPWAEHPMAELVLHIHRELIHHGAEIALLRDLHRATR
ncbi:DinB family protein [Nocardioides pacificus]